MTYAILLDPKAIEDIQKSIDHYEEQEPGLGKQFEEHLDQQFSVLRKNPHFQVRYDQVRCLPLNKFSHMIHYTIEEKKQRIIVRAVFHTSINPGKWKQRKR
ncbi:MAG: type II toxin-antitoxin system RelE/ParE family toxin [Bacteroidetes bacterium]|nr:type II toxin-antitoxin system RelE/ParE family toxin [Bacteroidota bacterium]